jgi:hypothetical protein
MSPTPQATQPYMGGSLGFNMKSQPVYDHNGTLIPHPYYRYSQSNRQFPFSTTLDLPYFSHLTNDPIKHAPFWTHIISKLSSDIPKFNEKLGEYPNNHVMTFHLWCSSNSLMDDSF